MKVGPGGFGTQYEHGIDFYNLDISGFEDIGSALKFSPRTALNLLVLPRDLQEEIQGQRNDNKQLASNGNQLKINLKAILDTLGIIDYEIVLDNNYRSIKRSKKSGVIYIGSMNDFGDFNISSINGHINQWKGGYMNKVSFGGRHTLPYVLFYDRKIPPTFSQRIKHLLGGIGISSRGNQYPLLHK